MDTKIDDESKGRRPFHESIVGVINEAQTEEELIALCRLIRVTDIPTPNLRGVEQALIDKVEDLVKLGDVKVFPQLRRLMRALRDLTTRASE